MNYIPQNERDHAEEAEPARERSRFAKSLSSTIPIVLVGSMAVGLNLTGPAPTTTPRALKADRSSPTPLGKSIRAELSAAHAASTAEATSTGVVAPASAPSEYTVVAGDTVSGIAGRFGIPTASVLAMNGIGWKSVIYPGQVLRLGNGAPVVAPAPAPAPAAAPTGSYTIVAGDTIGGISAKLGIPMQALLDANGLSTTSTIYAGKALQLPGTSVPTAVAAPVAIVSAPAPAPATRIGSTSHVIKTGETIAGIAATYGVSIQSILDANGLGWSSIIYAGRTLVIPSVPVAASTEEGVTPLTPEMAQNARTIIGVGRSVGANDRALVIALATAMQESSLLNLDYGDRDSLGLFQQRPSTGWGTPEQVTDPVYASRLFFGGPSAPNRGVTRGLLDIPGWESMTLTQAAQAVQISGHPDAYAKWETSAVSWLRDLG